MLSLIQTKTPRRGCGSSRISRGFLCLGVAAFCELNNDRLSTASGRSASFLPAARTDQIQRHPSHHQQQAFDAPGQAGGATGRGPRGTSAAGGGFPAAALFAGRSPGNFTGTTISASGARADVDVDVPMLPSGRWATASAAASPTTAAEAVGQRLQQQLNSERIHAGPTSAAGVITPTRRGQPKKKPKTAPKSAVMVFDWDDTLFPNWYVRNVVACFPDGYVNKIEQNPFRQGQQQAGHRSRQGPGSTSRRRADSRSSSPPSRVTSGSGATSRSERSSLAARNGSPSPSPAGRRSQGRGAISAASQQPSSSFLGGGSNRSGPGTTPGGVGRMNRLRPNQLTLYAPPPDERSHRARRSLSDEFVLTEDHPCWEDLKQHTKLVQDILDRALQHAHVAIVTLAKEHWVQRSAKMYMPWLDLSSIPIYYARSFIKPRHIRVLCEHEEDVCLSRLAKKYAMKRFLEKSFGKKQLYACRAQPDKGFRPSAHLRGSASSAAGSLAGGSDAGTASSLAAALAGVTICRPQMEEVTEGGLHVENYHSPPGEIGVLAGTAAAGGSDRSDEEAPNAMAFILRQESNNSTSTAASSADLRRLPPPDDEDRTRNGRTPRRNVLRAGSKSSVVKFTATKPTVSSGEEEVEETVVDPELLTISDPLTSPPEQLLTGLAEPGGGRAASSTQSQTIRLSTGALTPHVEAQTAGGGAAAPASFAPSDRQPLDPKNFSSVQSTAPTQSVKRKRDRTDFKSNDRHHDQSETVQIPGKAVTMPSFPRFGLQPSSGSPATLTSTAPGFSLSAGESSGSQLQHPLVERHPDGKYPPRMSGTTSVGAALTQGSLPDELFATYTNSPEQVNGGSVAAPYCVSTMVSVGDQCVERDAAQELFWELSDSDLCPIKTVKLAEDSSLPVLREQLLLLKKNMFLYLSPDSGDRNFDMPWLVEKAKRSGWDLERLDEQEFTLEELPLDMDY